LAGADSFIGNVSSFIDLRQSVYRRAHLPNFSCHADHPEAPLETTREFDEE
jgi:hypothetical protein